MIKRKLKASHFLLVILSALVVSIFIPALFVPSDKIFLFGLLAAGLALVSSLPFTIIFLLILRNLLNKDMSRKKFHLSVFIAHLIGALLTLFGFFLFNHNHIGLNPQEFGLLSMIIFAFFVYDSVGFYILIQKRYNIKIDPDQDILDDAAIGKKKIEF